MNRFEITTQLEPFAPEKERHRPARLANRIKEELMLLIPESLNDPRISEVGSITITNVTCAADMRNARVMFMLHGAEGKNKKIQTQAEELLNRAAGYLRREIHEKLNIKYTPILSFHFDHGLVNSQHIHNLLNQIN